MKKISTRARLVLMALVATLAFTSVASSASADLQWYYYHDHVQIGSGGTAVNTGFYVADGHALSGEAANGARPQVYFSSNGSGDRNSAMGSCETSFCTASYSWSPGPFPSGFPSTHHHGLGSDPDYFSSRVYDAR
jgi:hypothetical protein